MKINYVIRNITTTQCTVTQHRSDSPHNTSSGSSPVMSNSSSSPAPPSSSPSPEESPKNCSYIYRD